MEYHTTCELHLKVMAFWNFIGISPIHVVGVTRSKTDALSSGKIIGVDKQKDQQKNKIVPSSIPNFITNPEQEKEENLCKFPIYKVQSYQHSTRPIFWIMLSFFYCTLIYAVIKLVVFLRSSSSPISETRDNNKDEGILNVAPLKDHDHREIVHRTFFIVGSVVWSVYCATCCAGYFIHFFKAKELCQLTAKWQIVEGELISESKAMKVSGESVESYLKRQRKGLISFVLMIPISFISLGIGTTYFDDFPMNMYSSIPREWAIDRIWIKPLCFAFSWMQVGIFLICESQTETIALAFSRTLLKCLQILTKPATDFYAQHHQQNGHNNHENFLHATDPSHTITIIPNENFENMTRDEQTQKMLEIFKDSVERFQSLKNLMDDFNGIFRWGLLFRKLFTLIKVCSYVYLLLRHPRDTGFPGAIIFLYAGIAIFLKFGIILSTMGKVLGESKRFTVEWKKVLLVLFPNEGVPEERRLKCCIEFGFKMGFFYQVKAQTLLTFCSVVLTYLIILLQLQIY